MKKVRDTKDKRSRCVSHEVSWSLSLHFEDSVVKVKAAKSALLSQLWQGFFKETLHSYG